VFVYFLINEDVGDRNIITVVITDSRRTLRIC